jgi:GMP synthase (glutamine-hydrolysing)
MSGTNRVLVLNTFIENGLARSFDQAINRPLSNLKRPCHSIRVPALTAAPDLSPFSHIIISGSEASATDELAWFPLLETMIRSLVSHHFPILAICFGHQFLARTLVGRQSVQRSSSPEFGWLDLELKPNPLFQDINRITTMVSHYDEVMDLPPDFQILAASHQCAIHAFQYQDRPIWGLQFHPEYNLQEAGEIFDRVLRDDRRFSNYFVNHLQDISSYQLNGQILVNFLNSRQG